MRTAIALVATSLIITACADSPTPVAPKVAATPVATSSTAPAVTPSGGTVGPDLIKKAASVGYYPRTRGGLAVFCRKDADIGTRIPTEKCVNENQIEDTVQRLLQAQQDLQRGHICGSASCGAGGT
jgi:hypothetical protein